MGLQMRLGRTWSGVAAWSLAAVGALAGLTALVVLTAGVPAAVEWSANADAVDRAVAALVVRLIELRTLHMMALAFAGGFAGAWAWARTGFLAPLMIWGGLIAMARVYGAGVEAGYNPGLALVFADMEAGESRDWELQIQVTLAFCMIALVGAAAFPLSRFARRGWRWTALAVSRSVNADTDAARRELLLAARRRLSMRTRERRGER